MYNSSAVFVDYLVDYFFTVSGIFAIAFESKKPMLGTLGQ